MMPIWVEWTVFFIGVATFLFAIIWNARSDKRATVRDIEERVKDNTRINTKLDDISTVSREIKEEISLVKKDMQQHNERLIKLEESLKSAHKRVDTVESRLNRLGGEQI